MVSEERRGGQRGLVALDEVVYFPASSLRETMRLRIVWSGVLSLSMAK